MSLSFTEKLYEDYYQVIAIDGEILVDEKTDFQHVQIFDTRAHGRVMTLDAIVQITERDECSYSEMLSHVPMFEHGLVERVMIVGGGDFAIAEEVLKHDTVKHVDLCDIDGRVMDLCKDYFTAVHHDCHKDPRLHIHAEDAFQFLRQPENTERYDLIIADRPDPVGPAEVLFADAFYQSVSLALTEHGIAVFQTGVPYFQGEELTQTVEQLGRAFNHSGTYLTVTPTYIGGYMALTWGSRGTKLGAAPAEDIAARFAKAGFETDYYTPAVHAGSFALPRWVERLTGK